VTKDEDPIQSGIHRDAEDQYCHHGAAVRGRDEKPAQHGETKKARCGPGDCAEKAADLCSQCGIVTEHGKQAIGHQQCSDDRHRQQRRENEAFARNPSGPPIVPGADCMGRKRRHRGQDARAHDRNREIETGSEPRRGECRAAEAADHDRIRKPHRHLRQIGGGQRAGDSDSRPNLRDHDRTHRRPRKRSSHYFVNPRREQADGRITINNCIDSSSLSYLQQVCSRITRIS
jgi:hypothetical protein